MKRGRKENEREKREKSTEKRMKESVIKNVFCFLASNGIRK